MPEPASPTLHLYLSPHLDDAVLSCGGQIARLTAAGETVIVYTVMAGDPPDALPNTPILADLFRRWRTGPEPIDERRTEDAFALRELGAEAMHSPIPDCVFRVLPHASGPPLPLYPTEESLWGAPAAGDPAVMLLEDAPLPLPAAGVLHVPLGAGHHVDHRIVRDWGWHLAGAYPRLTVLYYEEYPYSREPGTVEAALAAFTAPLAPLLHPLDDAALAAKIAAIRRYESQLSTFWPEAEAMPGEVRAFAAKTGAAAGILAEREWQPPARSTS